MVNMKIFFSLVTREAFHKEMQCIRGITGQEILTDLMVEKTSQIPSPVTRASINIALYYRNFAQSGFLQFPKLTLRDKSSPKMQSHAIYFKLLKLIERFS